MVHVFRDALLYHCSAYSAHVPHDRVHAFRKEGAHFEH